MGDKYALDNDNSSEDVVRILDLYETREKIYTRRLEGFYRSLKRWTWIPMLSAYLLLPWVNIDGHQAILFDLPARKFYVFWLTFWPQDFMLLAWALIISAFLLFTVTVMVGRVWCGFSCPQTVWTMIFMVAEHWWEGDRNQRIKLDQAPWSTDKIIKKGGKFFTWFLVAFITGYTFVGYFNPIRQMTLDFFVFASHPAINFWTFFFTAMTFMNAGFLREQVCLYMCPYARFQSVMFDKDTLIVSYNAERGEPRGARKKGTDAASKGLGDCVDCSLCVQVCPTGIDIRDGLQYECISCGLCIDACDAVMKKMNYAPRLISFTTEHSLDHGKTRIFRSRFIGYTLVLCVMTALFLYTIGTRTPLRLDVIRDRAMLFRENSEGLIENIYTLRILNMDDDTHKFVITAEGEYNFNFMGASTVEVPGGEVHTELVRLELDPGYLKQPNTDVFFNIVAEDDAKLRAGTESRFIGPTVRRAY